CAARSHPDREAALPRRAQSRRSDSCAEDPDGRRGGTSRNDLAAVNWAARSRRDSDEHRRTDFAGDAHGAGGANLPADAHRVGLRARQRFNPGEIPAFARRGHRPVGADGQGDGPEARLTPDPRRPPLDLVARERASARRCKGGKAAFEIADQVIDILEPDMQPHGRSVRRPLRRCADAGAVEWNGQALEAAPRRADAEEAQRVDERVDRALRDRLEHDAEKTARAGEIAPPEGMAWTALERRMQHAGDLGARGEPTCDLQSRLMVLREPHAQGA